MSYALKTIQSPNCGFSVTGFNLMEMNNIFALS